MVSPCPICGNQLNKAGGCFTSQCPGPKIYQFQTIVPSPQGKPAATKTSEFKAIAPEIPLGMADGSKSFQCQTIVPPPKINQGGPQTPVFDETSSEMPLGMADGSKSFQCQTVVPPPKIDQGGRQTPVFDETSPEMPSDMAGASKIFQCQTIVPLPKIDQEESQTPVFDKPSTGKPSNMAEVSNSQEIQGYDNFHLIGKGGMGLVYEARQKSLNRRVAIKTLAPHLTADPMFVMRFEREAKALACLNHPNIVNIFDFGRQENIVYFVMEYVEAMGADKPRDLQQVLASGPMPFLKAISLVIQITKALEVAHKQGIIHRDIKPANIMLDTHGNAKVTDFGIASFDNGDLGITRSGSAMGTFGYMAPEQAKNATKADGRSDIFSVGVLIYELVTGELPMGTYIPPSKWGGGIPKGMDDIVAKATAPRPENRFQKIGDLGEALDALLTQKQDFKPETKLVPLLTSCPNCRSPLKENSQYCGTCGENLRLKCPKCQLEITGKIRFCPNCRLEIHLYQKRECHRERGRIMMAKANGIGPHLERGEWAADAVSEFTLARQSLPGDDYDSQMREKASRLGVSLLAEAGQLSANHKQYHQATQCYQKILKINPTSLAGQQALQKLQNLQDKSKQEIEESLVQGDLKKLNYLLDYCDNSYRGNKIFESELIRAREKLNLGHQALTVQIPAFLKVNAFQAIVNLLKELQSQGVQLPQFQDIQKKADSRLLKAGDFLRAAKDQIDKGNQDSAFKLIQQAEGLSSDLPDLKNLLKDFNKDQENQKSIKTKVENAVHEGRWFRAAELLTRFPQAGNPNLISQTWKGLKESQLGNTLTVFAFLGSLIWVLVSYPAQLGFQGLLPILPSNLPLADLLRSGIQTVCGIGAVLFFLGIWKKKVQFSQPILGMIGIAVPWMAIAVINWNLFQIDSWSKEPVLQKSFLVFANTMISVCLLLVTGLAIRRYLVLEETINYLFKATFFGGIGTFLTLVSLIWPAILLNWLPLGILISGSLAVSGLCQGFRRYPLIITGAFLGGVVGSGSEEMLGSSVHFGLWSYIILAITCILSLTSFNIVSIFKTGIHCLVLTVLWDLIRPQGALVWILPSWFVFWGEIATTLNYYSDFKLHSWDRLLWIWQRFFNPQKGSISKINIPFWSFQPTSEQSTETYFGNFLSQWRVALPLFLYCLLGLGILLGTIIWSQYESNLFYVTLFSIFFILNLAIWSIFINVKSFSNSSKMVISLLVSVAGFWVLGGISLFQIFGNQVICNTFGQENWHFVVSETDGFEIFQPKNLRGGGIKHSVVVVKDFDTNRTAVECLRLLELNIKKEAKVINKKLFSNLHGFDEINLFNTADSEYIKVIAVPRHSNRDGKLMFYHIYVLNIKNEIDYNDYLFMISFNVRKIKI
ncbi:MAG: hypothetical protein EXS48_01915 [Candidatus Staskawiczbacteria bacterium]|nr:hypothetical protein [Candidatus Staskawiczbacteria bacterium]